MIKEPKMSGLALEGPEPPATAARSDPRDLAPVIEELMRAAKAAITLSSAAGMQAAKDLLIAAAELKQRLPASPAAAAALEPEMTLEEWQKRFKPRT